MLASGGWGYRRGRLTFTPAPLRSPSFGFLKELPHFVASSWYEVCGRISKGHLHAGTHVEEVRKWSRATSYMERYVAKPEQFPEGVETSRVWRTGNEEMLPVR